MRFEEWKGFASGAYEDGIDVRNFIQVNYTPYEGGREFLAGPTARTNREMERVNILLKQEHERGGVLDIDNTEESSLLAYGPGYLNKEDDIIVGFQTNQPLKRGVNLFGGIRMARSACEAYGSKLSEKLETEFKYRTTHNDGVYRVYTPDMRKVRKLGLLTGLPDAYGRGRIIGDYRRVALYGVDFLIQRKEEDKLRYGENLMDQDNIRQSEELFSQIDFLNKL